MFGYMVKADNVLTEQRMLFVTDSLYSLHLILLVKLFFMITQALHCEKRSLALFLLVELKNF